MTDHNTIPRRNIREGDIVSVFVSQESSIYHLVNWWPAPCHEREARQFRVLHTPSDTGDLWYLEGWLEHQGIELAINPSSADFDAVVLRLTAKDAADHEASLAHGGEAPADGTED